MIATDSRKQPNAQWDDVVRGLHLRRGARKESYYLFYRTRQGTQRRPKLGEHPAITLQEARKRATAILSRVAVGEDPSGDWKAARAEMRVSEIFDKAWKEHWNVDRYQRSGWAREVRRLFERRIKQKFGAMRLSDVTVGAVYQWHRSMKSTPVEANRALEVFTTLVNFALREELHKGTNVCAVVPGFRERKRTRYATPDEIRRLGISIVAHAETNPRGVAFIMLLMLLGIRPLALTRVRRDEYDGEVLSFHGKTTEQTGEPEVVVVPEAAKIIIDKLPVRSDGLLIGGPRPIRLWQRIRKDAGCEDLWLRDWRRTFGTIGLSHGIGLSLIGELLNHRSTSTTQRYAKLLPEARREAAGRIADEITKLLK